MPPTRPFHLHHCFEFIVFFCATSFFNRQRQMNLDTCTSKLLNSALLFDPAA